jgi:colanic acid biosynthesis protein WcaH
VRVPHDLSPKAFADIVRQAPLVSIDLILRDAQDRVLVGRRVNPPAQGWWFVPGGRIRKDEGLAEAITRLLKDEIGWTAPESASFTGVYEHFYAENFLGTDAFSTHIVVLAYSVDLGTRSPEPPRHQHSEYRWLKIPELLAAPDVHRYTQAYFLP